MRKTVRQIGFCTGLATVICLVLNESVQSQGNLYVSSFGGDQVLLYDATTGAFVDTLITNLGGQLDQPHGIFDRGIDLLVTSAVTDEVLRYNRITGELLGTFIGPSSGIDYPVYMAIGPDELLYVSSQLSDEIIRFNRDTGAFVDVFVTAGSGGLSGPSGFAFGSDGRLYVAGRFSGTVAAYSGTTGAYEETIADPNVGLGAGNTFGLQFGDNDDLYFVSNGQTFRYDLDDESFITLATGGIGLEAGPNCGMFVATGNNLRLINTSDNSIGPPFLGAGGVINTLNFFHFSFLDGPSADFDLDGDVDAVDLNVWEAAYGVSALGDTDSDGDSDGFDFLAWQLQNGIGLPTPITFAATIPEPATLLLSLVGWMLNRPGRRAAFEAVRPIPLYCEPRLRRLGPPQAATALPSMTAQGIPAASKVVVARLSQSRTPPHLCQKILSIDTTAVVVESERVQFLVVLNRASQDPKIDHPPLPRDAENCEKIRGVRFRNHCQL